MKELQQIKSGKFLTDDSGLVILWQPILNKVKDPEGVITYRDEQNKPICLFRLLSNEHNFEGKAKFDDEDGEIIIEIKGNRVIWR